MSNFRQFRDLSIFHQWLHFVEFNGFELQFFERWALSFVEISLWLEGNCQLISDN